MTLQGYIDVTALLLLITANSVPVVVGRLLGHRFEAPIDGGFTLPDGNRFLGAHKTWRGLVTGVVAAGIAGSLLSKGFAAGAAFGALALLGDLLSSFVKRRLSFRSGHRSVLLDQVPEALLPLIVMAPVLGITPREIIGTTLTFILLDIVTERLRPRERPPEKRQAAPQG